MTFPNTRADERLRPLARVPWRVAAVENHGVPVWVATGREVADAGVPRLRDELNALRFQFGPSLRYVRHA